MSRLDESFYRQPRSFGIAGLLPEGRTIYHETLFGTQSLGRSLDLALARIRLDRPVGIGEEARIRCAAVIGILDAFLNAKTSEGGAALQVSWEIAATEDRIVVGVGFIADGVPIDEAGVERVRSDQAEFDFESAVVTALRCSDVWFKRHQASGRFEIVFLIPSDEQGMSFKGELQLMDLTDEESQVAPTDSAYEAFGDLDHQSLVGDDRKVGAQEGEDSSTVIKGGEEEDQGEWKVKGSGAAETAGGDLELKSGGSEEDGPQGKRAKLYQDQIKTLNTKIAALERELDEEKNRVVTIVQDEDGEEVSEKDAEESESEEDSEESADSGDTFWGFAKRMVKKVRPFSKKAGEEVDSDDGEESASDAEEPVSDEMTAQVLKDLEDEPSTDSSSGDSGSSADETKKFARNMLEEIESGKLAQTLKRAQEESEEIKSDLKSPKAKRWVDGLMSDIVAEKAKIKELATRLGRAVKVKELEFRNRENQFSEEMRRKEETLRQRDAHIARLKDQVSQMTIGIERLRSQNGKSGADVQLKKRLDHQKGLLDLAKDEANQFKKKAEELQRQLQFAKNTGPTAGDLQLARERVELLERQLEDTKKQNLNAMQVAATHKRETERLKQELEQKAQELANTSKAKSA